MKTSIRTHPFQPDASLPASHTGDPLCTCGLPRPNRAHTLPTQTEEQRALDARRTGESR